MGDGGGAHARPEAESRDAPKHGRGAPEHGRGVPEHGRGAPAHGSDAPAHGGDASERIREAPEHNREASERIREARASVRDAPEPARADPAITPSAENAAAWLASELEPEPEPDVSPGLELLLADLTRAIGCEVAVVSDLDPDGRPTVLCATGVDADVAISTPTTGSAQRGGGSSRRRDGFVGRALEHGRPAYEPLDPDLDAGLIHGFNATLKYALATPIEGYERGRRGVLVVGFATPPANPGRAFWIADAYARLVALTMSDAQALRELMERVHRDALTGCLTHQSVVDELNREVSRSTRTLSPLSCCFIDLDGFKSVNDRHGHLHGNEVLAHVGRVLRDGLRSCDTVGRFGGDEFVAILPQTSSVEAAQLAGRLRVLIASGHEERHHEPLTASIGIAQWAPGMAAEELLGLADGALYAAKALPGGIAIHGHAARTAGPADSPPVP